MPEPGMSRSLVKTLGSTPRGLLIVLALLSAVAARFGWPASYRTENLLLRSKTQSVAVYDPRPDSQRRAFQVVVTSGDLGWIGLSADIAEHLQANAYRVIGFNSRAYLSSFTTRDSALKPEDVSEDLRTLLGWAASSPASVHAFVLIGVSEGAGLSVVGAGQLPQLQTLKGVIALGLPRETTLGWRWTDFPMWVTKRNPREPLTATSTYLSQLRTPFVMIHSTHDEWDPIESARAMFALAPEPKKFFAIAASNHRFSDRLPEVLTQIDSALAWMATLTPLQAP